jgi:hypothetical protein
MRRAWMLGLAIVLTLALGVATTQAKPKKVKVDSEVSIEGYETKGPPDVTFFGEVGAEKRKCVRNRTVNLEQITDELDAGSDKSDHDGDWNVTFNGFEIDPGDFQATVEKRKIKKKKNGEVKKVFICKKAVSPVFSVKD